MIDQVDLVDESIIGFKFFKLAQDALDACYAIYASVETSDGNKLM